MAKRIHELDLPPATPDQRALINHFLVAFAAIEVHFRDRLKAEAGAKFGDLVTKYEQLYPAWRMGQIFREFAIVRNSLVHNESKPGRYLVIPLPQVVREIERQRKVCLQAEQVRPRFKQIVITVDYREPLTEALAVMYAKEYSQLPVYDHAEFKGLLTENAVARWLAQNLDKHGPRLDLSGTRVAAALHEGVNCRRVEFVSQERDLVEVTSQSIVDPLLQAVLITKTGNPSEKLLGIITTWDVAHLE